MSKLGLLELVLLTVRAPHLIDSQSDEDNLFSQEMWAKVLPHRALFPWRPADHIKLNCGAHVCNFCSIMARLINDESVTFPEFVAIFNHVKLCGEMPSQLWFPTMPPAPVSEMMKGLLG